jgi:hypothetical protein
LVNVVLGVQIEYDVVHLRTYLFYLFAILKLNFEEIVQIIELWRFGGAPNGYPFAALRCLPNRVDIRIQDIGFVFVFE